MHAFRCALTLLTANGVLAEQQYQRPSGHVKPPQSDRNPFTDEFSALAKNVMEEWHAAGLSLAVVDDKSVFTKGFGFARFPDTPATAETLYYVGSTTKAHTAAVLSHFIDTKKFDGLAQGWSTTISSLIPDDFVLQNEWATRSLTLDDAVSHRSGMASHDTAWHEEINGSQATVKDIVRNFRNLPYGIEPRVKWWYCNSLYVTLSHIIETLTGKWLGLVFKEVIWEPLGMNHTYMDLEQAEKSDALLATAYKWSPDSESYLELETVSTTAVSGAGAAISNVNDYAKWLQCLIHEGEPFSKAVHKDIRTPRFLASDQPSDGSDVVLYGLAWMRTIIHGHVAYWHTGSVMTFEAYVYWFPELKYSIVAFSNSGLVSKPVEHVLVRRLMEDRMGIPPSDRLDVNKIEKDMWEGMRKAIDMADEVLYPNKPKDPAPPTLGPGYLVGKYFHKGYGTVTLFEEPLSAGSDKTILVTNRTELTWKQQWRIQHVFGDHWTLYSKMLFGVDEIFAYGAAHFKFGANGKVSGLEITLINGNLLEGAILFDKVED